MSLQTSDAPESTDDAIERYLRSGDHDLLFLAWSGENGVLARCRQGNAALRQALISAIQERAPNVIESPVPTGLDVIAFTRAKVAPMVRGLFPATEQELMLDVLGRSVVFLTPERIASVLEQMPWLNTAWDLANLYLGSVDAPLLAEDAPSILGLSAETTCFVSMAYFKEQGRFDDFVVHEAAHVFHNCQRQMIGLPQTRRREYLLDIDFARRETFAYACEAYSRIQELGHNVRDRQALLVEHEQGAMPPDDRVDAAEYVDILREAVAARNGWQRILKRCAPLRP